MISSENNVRALSLNPNHESLSSSGIGIAIIRVASIATWIGAAPSMTLNPSTIELVYIILSCNCYVLVFDYKLINKSSFI